MNFFVSNFETFFITMGGGKINFTIARILIPGSISNSLLLFSGGDVPRWRTPKLSDLLISEEKLLRADVLLPILIFYLWMHLAKILFVVEEFFSTFDVILERFWNFTHGRVWNFFFGWNYIVFLSQQKLQLRHIGIFNAM